MAFLREDQQGIQPPFPQQRPGAGLARAVFGFGKPQRHGAPAARGAGIFAGQVDHAETSQMSQMVSR